MVDVLQIMRFERYKGKQSSGRFEAHSGSALLAQAAHSDQAKVGCLLSRTRWPPPDRRGMGLDVAALIAAMLHDCIEDTGGRIESPNASLQLAEFSRGLTK
jgi:hypothetical protein